MRRAVSLLDHLPLPTLRNSAALQWVREAQLFSSAVQERPKPASLAQLRREGAVRAIHIAGPAEYAGTDLRDVFAPKKGRPPKSGVRMTGAERIRAFRARQREKSV